MLKLFIIDDQKKDLDGICGILDWEELGIELCGTAKNGKDGLARALQLRPDIIITDVVMPVMDGLAFVDKVRQQLPNAKIIITSCYDDFGFVQKAIELGAVGYVLKPLIASDLLKAVIKASEICNHEKRLAYSEEILENTLAENLSVIRDNFLKNTLLGLYDSEQKIRENIAYLGCDIPEGALYGVLYIVIDKQDCASAKEVHLQSVGVRSVVVEFLSGKMHGHVVHDGESQLVCLVAVDGCETANRLVKAASGILGDIQLRLDIVATIGVSPLVSSLIDISRCYAQAKDAIKLKFKLGKGIAIMAEDNIAMSQAVEYRTDCLLSSVKTALLSDDAREIDAFVLQATAGQEHNEAYLQFISAASISYAQLTLMEMNESLKNVFESGVVPYDSLFCAQTAAELQEALSAMLRRIHGFIQTRSNQRNRRVVDVIIAILERDYARNISIGDVAREVYLSPSYTSYVFKQEMGENFTEYLIRLRLEKAQALLKGSNYKVFEIAGMVGYTNNSYFCAVFKDRYGITPREYRESAGK